MVALAINWFVVLSNHFFFVSGFGVAVSEPGGAVPKVMTYYRSPNPLHFVQLTPS